MRPKAPGEKQNSTYEALFEGNPPAVLQAAATCFASLRTYIMANSGSEEDARDLVQDAVLVVYRQAKSGALQLHAPLGAYLFGICQKQWLHRLREKKRTRQVTNERPVEYSDETASEAEWRQAERYRLYLEKLNELDESGRQLLELDAQNVPLKEIAVMLNYTYNYVRQKKSECLAKLTRLIRQDPRYDDLK